MGEIRGRAAPHGELDQRRQKSCQGLATAGRGDQQRALALPREVDQSQLMLAGRPAATFEPAGKKVRQAHICGVGYPLLNDR
jgi:hypothetical protein